MAMFEKSGLLASTTQVWRLRPTAQWTMATFQAEFGLANTERIRLTTAANAGYHGANHASTPTNATALVVTPSSHVPQPSAAAATAPTVLIDNVTKMYYCWSHGLSTNKDHTSATCTRKGNGHQDTATVLNLQGGNNTIANRRPARRLANNHPPATSHTTAIADTGCTSHFCTIDAHVINKRPTSDPIAIQNPNGTLMYSTHEAELDLPQLPPAACHIHIVPALHSVSLLSMGQLCDAGCTVKFTAQRVEIFHHTTLLLTGSRTASTRLWHVNLVDTTTTNPTTIPLVQQANGAVGSATPAQIVAYAHATLFSPTLATLHAALIKMYLTNFPGLTAKSLRKHPPRSIPMIKGHLDQSHKNQRSTKPIPLPTLGTPAPQSPPPIDDDPDTFPVSESPNARTHHCYASVITTTGQIHSDQTGRFVIPSSNGNNYLVVLCDYDSNAILVHPMRNRTDKSILEAYTILHTRLCAAGLTPRLQRLDNKCSIILKQYMHEANINFQLVPPGCHRRNAAERCIRTFQNHFIAGLCSVDKDFLLHLWDKLIPQAELTLNLLRGSRINPKLSAHAQIHGHFDFNATPLAPPGMRIIAHEKPEQRTTWSPHGLDGWYVGPALDSYRCYEIWIWETRSTRICDTISWFPTKLPMPMPSSTDLILAGIQDILLALANPSPRSPLAPLTDNHVSALNQLTHLLTNIASPLPTATIPSLAPELPVPSPRVLTSTAPALPTPSPRVIPETATPVHLTIPPLHIQPPATHNTPLRPSLRVATHPRLPTPTRKVQFASMPPSYSAVTYANSTGPTGKKHCRKQRTKLKTPVPRRTLHPNLLKQRRISVNKRQPKPPRMKRAPPTHTHGTRAKAAPLQHVAAAAATLFSTTDLASPNCRHSAFHGNAFNPDTGKLAEFLELSKCSEGALWQASNAAEIGRLAQGFGDVTGTNTIFFIDRHAIPKDRKVTYLRVVSAVRPEKTKPRRVRWTVGGDKIDYPGDVSTKTADLCTVKLLINSVLSTPDAKFMTGDLKDFYLGTLMNRYEYMRVPTYMLPPEIVAQYKMEPLMHKGYVYVEIRRGMYGLPQAGKIANDQLIRFLQPHGYAPVPLTHGLWKHNTRAITFTLVVDNFGVKYTRPDDAAHLITTLEQFYQVSTDWTGARYCGLTLAWDYLRRTCNLSMPGYIERALQRFQHPPPTTPEYSPHAWQRPNYGAKTQFAVGPDKSPALDAKDITRIMEILSTLLYYGRAIDSTLLAAIGELATQQAQSTTHTMNAITQLLNYCATNPNATIRFVASDMILAVESDASYLSVSKARSRAAGYFFLTNKSTDPNTPYADNGAVHVLCQIMREVLSSASEAELGALFHNGKEACPIRIALEEMGHPQPATPMQTDNSTATGIANETVKQKRSKAVDMRFYWIRDRVRKGQFHIYWAPGNKNKADYFSKHHPTSHHRAIRSTYIYSPDNPNQNYSNVWMMSRNLRTVSKASPPKAPPILEQSFDCGEGVLFPGEPGVRPKEPGSPDHPINVDHNPQYSEPLIV